MSEKPGEHEQPRTASEEAANPTDEELDVEGPNESGPGHEPEDGDGQDGGPSER